MKVVLKDLKKVFPSRNRKDKSEVVVIDHCNLEIEDGKLISLLGPSGCGKSTTLNMICGLEKPTEGRIFFGETDVTDLLPEERGVGVVFQNYALYPHLTVRENIRFPLENLKKDKKMTRQQMEEKVFEAAKLVQMEELLDRKPNELSGGQQQRVAIARAMVKQPKILLLDEPLSNLDARLRLQTREEIRRIQRETGITTIFVTHDQEEAISISDVIVVMQEGVLQQVGKPQDVYDDPANLFVAQFLGTPPINLFEGAVEKEQLLIGKDVCLAVSGVADGPVTVGIRPEGFVPDHEGALHCHLSGVEVMGRDVTIVSTNEACKSKNVRSIVEKEKLQVEDEVRFHLKPKKVLLFDPVSGERIRTFEDVERLQRNQGEGRNSHAKK